MDLMAEIKKLKAFRNKINALIRDPRMSKYSHTRIGLAITSVLYKHKIKGLIEFLRSGEEINTDGNEITHIDNRFDSCSYKELTECVNARIKWIREYKEIVFSADIRNSHKEACELLEMKIRSNEDEIKDILRMRREMKLYGVKTWGTCKERINQELR